jgi:TATA-box binding protein (TBP) (component of TFIID and TFIIIB)
MENLKVIKNFEDYNISTQTLIISTNINVNCDNFYNSINCVELNKSPLKNKNKMLVDLDEKLENGDIVYAQYKTNHKGVYFKKKIINSEKYFLNSVTIIMKVEEKFINIKVSNKGKLQITGCSKYYYSTIILDLFWKLIFKNTSLWNYKDELQEFTSIIIPVMCNINFSIGFEINRVSLNDIINRNTEFTSILEPSDGYVGVNIKIPIEEELMENILIDNYTFNTEKQDWIISKTKFIDYIDTLTLKEKKKKLSKSYMNTFLVFYSGKVIMSGGISFINRKKAYETFINIIKQYKDKICN